METVNGKTIKSVIANQSPHKFAWFSGDSDEYLNLLSVKSVTGTAAYGGMAKLKIESYKMVFCEACVCSQDNVSGAFNLHEGAGAAYK